MFQMPSGQWIAKEQVSACPTGPFVGLIADERLIVN